MDRFRTDVLVIGGGPAGTWAAHAAAKAGAAVILADKGFCGTSGATAPSGTGVWYVPPDPAAREAAIQSRLKLGGRLQHRDWMDRVLDATFENMNQLAAETYAFPTDEDGVQRRNGVQGPDYMRFMRKRVKAAGVRILDHSPALGLLRDEMGQVAGALGYRRQALGAAASAAWQVEAGAVVMATGGCAFLSKALGCNVLTGDGYLMAAEAGADFSGMEFSNAYAVAPAFASVTKTRFYDWAVFTDEAGEVIPGAGSKGGRSVIARHLDTVGPVYARLELADGATQIAMRRAQPNFFVPFDRHGIDPFTTRFPVTLRLEGTVRGTGGLRLVGQGCETSVPGLYAAGDAATRELICGAFTGGGSHNAAWAMSSGRFAGESAAAWGKAAMRSAASRTLIAPDDVVELAASQGLDAARVIEAVQDEVFPFDRNYFRTGDKLAASLERLDTLWERSRDARAPDLAALVRHRENKAMLATARWMYKSALARTETRGMHKRYDARALDPAQRRHVIAQGLDEIAISFAAAGAGFEEAALERAA